MSASRYASEERATTKQVGEAALDSARIAAPFRRSLWIAAWVWISICCCAAMAIEPLDTSGRHPLYYKTLPPGNPWQSPAAVTMQQGTFQPVAFAGPEGTHFSMPLNGTFAEAEPNLMAGLMVGAVYRFRITEIPRAPGVELYPTVELLGRLCPPPGLETRFPIPINLSQTDLEEALAGNLVTRVVYLEDQQTAVPLAKERSDSRPIDIPLDQDAMAMADSMGRPIAIVRVGSKAPPNNAVLAPQFYFGYPAWAPIYQAQTPPTPAVTPAAAEPTRQQ